jgi:hypothetical protein
MSTSTECPPPEAGSGLGASPDPAPDPAAGSTVALLVATTRFATEWAGALPAFGIAGGPAGPGGDAELMSDGGLLRAMQAGFAAKRQLEAFLTAGAGQLAHRSRSELGAESLAKQNGWGNAPALLAELGRITTAEAGRLCRVGDATRDRTNLQGERLPARWAAVAAAVNAVNAGDIGVDSALAIISSLGQASPRAPHGAVETAERMLVEFSGQNPADSVRKLSILCRDRLDTDGIEPREQELITERSLRYSSRPNGMERLEVLLDPLSMSYVRAGIEGLVGDTLRKVRFEQNPTTHPGDCADGCDDHHETLTDRDADGRTIEQIRADALVDSFKHVLSCQNAFPALQHTTIVVRLDLDTLTDSLRTAQNGTAQNGTAQNGTAQIDGAEQPISAATARKLAADADIIPLVLGGNSEILDLGRKRRLFTRAQKLALIDRDGGCAWSHCNKPPAYTEVHHLRWWKKHAGLTNLLNGVLLCSAHHHLLHREGWDIHVIDNIPWFIPPATIDTTQTPRRGGRIQEPAAA